MAYRPAAGHRLHMNVFNSVEQYDDVLQGLPVAVMREMQESRVPSTRLYRRNRRLPAGTDPAADAP